MFTKEDLKNNLLGCLEVALLMPQARNRFGKTADDALKSFLIPVFFFPFTLLFIYNFPQAAIADHSRNTISLLYSMRLVITWGLFLGTVYLILKKIDRKEYFCQFVTALNWLTVPTSVIYIPVIWLYFSGAYSLEELMPFIYCIIGYSYFFTAFMAAYVLRVPWELACFVIFIGIVVNEKTIDILYWISSVL